MRLNEFLNEDDNTQTDDISSIISSKNWQKLFELIQPINKGSSIKGFNIGNDYIPFRNTIGAASEKFKAFVKQVRSACHNNVEHYLTKPAQHIKDKKVRYFVQQNLLPALIDPESVSKSSNKSEISDPSHYKNVAIALVYRSADFVSRMSDSHTEISPKIFSQLMVDAFNGYDGGNNKENFLLSFTNIDQKMSLDAAKKTVEQTKNNGDADEQLGKVNTDENYYETLQNSLDFIFENDTNITLPRSIHDFSEKLPVAMKQVEAVKRAWPRQYKGWYQKYEEAFNEGLKTGQDDVRDSSKKELTDPLTNKKISGRKTLGSGGPNAWLNDFKQAHPTCGNWIDSIKDDKWTIFNMGPKILFKLFDGIEAGGKFLQGFCDGIASGIKDIKKAFRSSSSVKDFNKQIDEYLEENNYGAGLAVAKASAVVQFTDLLNLLQNGPIGTVNLKERTFTTAMSNSQTSIEVAMQNCLASLDKYTDTAKRFDENKDVKINSNQTDTYVGNDIETKNTKEPEKDDDSIEDDEEENENFVPSLKSFIISEADDSDDESTGEKVDDKDDESSTGITQSDSENQTLSELELIKQDYDNTIDKNRLKEVMEVLSSFKGEEGDVIRNKKGEESDFTNLDKIIKLYELLSSNDLKFNLNAASLKDFLGSIKNYLDEFKEIPPIENLTIKLSEKSQKLPAMDSVGELEMTTTGEEKAKALAKKIEDIQNKFISERIANVNDFAKKCENDNWLNDYDAAKKSLNEYGSNLRQTIADTYGKVPDWFDKYFAEFQTKNYLTKLYMLMSAMTNIRKQLEKMSANEENEPDEEVSESVQKSTKLIRSLYLTEKEAEKPHVNDGNNDPTQKAHNQEDFRKGGKQEAVKHSINELWSKINKIDLNSALLSTKYDADVYLKNSPENFNALSRKFAQNATGLQITHVHTGNGIASIIRHVLDTSTDMGKKNVAILKQNNCTKIASLFAGDKASENTNRNDADLFLLFAAAHGCAKALMGSEQTDKDFDTKRPNKEQKQANQQNNSYEYPNVSKDSFLNEIYKYIRG